VVIASRLRAGALGLLDNLLRFPLLLAKRRRPIRC
jgi:hypothetical protein